VVRLEQASSFVSAQLREFATANPSCGDETPALPSTLPGFSPVFLPCKFSCAPKDFFIGLELTAISRQSLRKFLGEVSLPSEALNTALLQQTATSTALCRPGDLAAIHHHVGVNRIREAGIVARAAVSSSKLVGYSYELCALIVASQRAAQSAMNFFVNSD
jgi:hypothetical protein